jgi:hypothetical protein
MPVWPRRLITLACVLAAWLVVRPAAASAPLCDDRAASVLAPPPVLDTPNASLDVGEHDSGCDGWVAGDHAYQRGERSVQVSPSARIDFVPSSVTCAVPISLSTNALRPTAENLECPGVRFLLERPPRH